VLRVPAVRVRAARLAPAQRSATRDHHRSTLVDQFGARRPLLPFAQPPGGRSSDGDVLPVKKRERRRARRLVEHQSKKKGQTHCRTIFIAYIPLLVLPFFFAGGGQPPFATPAAALGWAGMDAKEVGGRGQARRAHATSQHFGPKHY
jgi:hypothetical protein